MRGAAAARARPLVGRAGELEALREAVVDARIEGRGRVALIEGEAGIGKTRLLEELLEWARGRDFDVLFGSARELERDRPFGVLVDALELEADSADGERAEIGRLLGAESPEGPGQAPQLRFRVVDAIVALVERLATREPLVLALEDLHWADPSTLLVLDRLAGRMHELRLVLVATRRPLPNPPELRSFADSADPHGIRLVLESLDDPFVQALVAGLAGAEPGDRLLATVAGAGGNPLFLEELVEALRSEGSIGLVNGCAEVEAVLLPPSLRLTILRRLTYLSDETLEVLRIASVLGASFSPSDLAAVLGLRGVDLLARLTEAVESGVLADEVARLAFRHDLVRDAIYEDVPVALRRALHLDVARALATAGAPARQVATHFVLGATAGEAEAVEWLLRAAREVFPTAPAIAVGFLERAQELARADDPRRDEIAAELVRSLLWSGRLGDAERLANDFLADERDPEAVAGVRYALARVLVYQGRVADSIDQVEAALADPRLADRERARLQGDLALRRAVVLDLEGAEAAAEQAQDLGDRVGDDLASSTARSARAWTTALRGRSYEAVELARSGVVFADRRALEPVQVVQARLYLGRALLDADELEEAGRTLEEARSRAEELGAVWGVPLASAVLALQRYEAGLWDDAVAEAETSLLVADEVQTSIWNPTAHAVLALVALHRDELAAAERVLRASEPALDRPGGPRVGLDRLRLAHGRLAEARGDTSAALAFLEQAWRENLGTGAFGDYRELAPELVRLALAARRTELAAEVADTVARAVIEPPPPSARLAALRCRGLADGDSNVLEEAASMAEQPRPLDGALAQLDAGVALGREARTEEAVAFLRAAAATFEQLGAVRQVARTEAALRELGVRRGRRGKRSRPLTGWESMTESEHRIALLVAEGLSNPEIAARLFISRRTVETHVSHILRRLDLSSRVQLAAEAVRRADVAS